MEFLILSIAVQAGLIIHCIKTGRNQIWVWVLALLSWPGAIAYVAVEIIPEFIRGRSTKRAFKGVSRVLDPERELRAAADVAKVTGNVAAKQAYASELVKQDRAVEAIGVYKEILTGLYEHDPNLMLGLAQAQFSAQDPAAARETLDALIEHNPEFKSPDGHLLYAQALEAEGNLPKALDEFQVLANYYPGAEAPVRYARLLRSQGRNTEADAALQTLLDHARIAPAHYRRAQREWLDAAEREMGS